MNSAVRLPARFGPAAWRAWIVNRPIVESARRRIFQPRGPESGAVFLNQRRVFVLPSGAGLLFAAMLVALLLGSINYLLSLGFALTFLLASIAWIGMFFTFRNLAHLTLRAGRVEPVFAGEIAEFGIVIQSRSRFDRFAVSLQADMSLAPVWADPAAGTETAVSIPVRITRRGRHAISRITLETTFPLGLWRAWSYWQPAMEVLAFPTPGPEGEPLPRSHADDPGGATARGRGSEDFAGVRAYLHGDSPRHLAWKAMAREPEGALLIKLLDGSSHTQIWLDLALAPSHLGIESALSCLTRWVLECEADGLRYGLRLGSLTIAPSLGPEHAHTCLTALALYQLPQIP